MEKHFLGYRSARKIDRQKVNRRNGALIARYYYLSEMKRLRFDDVISKLTTTFFLSDAYVLRVLSNSNDKFVEMSTNRPEKDYFKAHWPEYDWS